MVAVTLFVVSMSTILFFFGQNSNTIPKDLKADVMESNTVTESIDVKSLQEKEKTYRKLVSNQEDSVFVMNVDGTIKFSSWDVETNLGYKQDDLNNQIFFLLINPEDLSTFLGSFGKVIQSKKPVFMVGPYRLRDKDGEYHLHMGALTPIVTDGNVEEIAVSSKDISKKAEVDVEKDKDKTKNKDTQKQNQKPAQPRGKKILNEKGNEPGRFLAEKPGDGTQANPMPVVPDYRF